MGIDGVQIHSGGWTDARHRDGMKADAVLFFQVFVMDHHGQGFKVGVVETEEHAGADIVNAAGHGPVKGSGVIPIVLFGAIEMIFLVGGLVVGFLEKNIGADAHVF